MTLLLTAMLAAATANAAAANPSTKAAAGTGAGMYAYLVGENGQTKKVPFFDEKTASTPIVRIGSTDDVIRLEELVEAVASSHEGLGKSHARDQDISGIVERLTDVHLLALEARDMGIDKLPEVQQEISGFKQQAARNALRYEAVRGVKADPREVARLYRERIQEYKIVSLLFRKQEDATAFDQLLRSGKDFDALAKQAIAEKKAEGGGTGEFFPRGKLVPEVATALDKLKPVAVTAPVKVSDGYVITKLEDVRQLKDDKVRAEAEKDALQNAEQAALKKYYQSLVTRHARVDRALLKRLDFEAPKPGFAALAKDKRVLATIQGDKPITIADLVTEFERDFFHGTDQAIKSKKLNAKKVTVFEGLLQRRVLDREAVRVGVANTESYRHKVERFTAATCFTAFVEKVIYPDQKVTPEQVRKYYDDHQKEYAYPAMYKLESIGFRDAKEAQRALDKLRGGTDFKWLRQNADGQLAADARSVQFDGNTVAADTMPEDLVKTLAGARAGDYRLYAAPDKATYVLYVISTSPAGAQPFDEVKDAVTRKLLGDSLNRSVKDWAAKVRKVRPVKVYITGIGS